MTLKHRTCDIVSNVLRARSCFPMALAALAFASGGCAQQGPYVAPVLAADGASLVGATPALLTEQASETGWWTRFQDPLLDALVQDALRANPTVSRAVAALELARAEAGVSRATGRPTVNLNGSASAQDAGGSPGAPGGRQDSASLGLALSWELDLFGRLRSGAAASGYRLESREAEAEAIRLALVADVADSLFAFRACNNALATLEAEIVSRQMDFDLTVRRRDAGFDAELNVAQAATGLASTRTLTAQRRQECAGFANALSLLTGEPSQLVYARVHASPLQPSPPKSPETVSTTLLVANPGVAAAERAVAAAWADIETARAERMPRIDLASALTGQWVSALGTSGESNLASVTASLTAPLFDAGRGAATVDAARARHAMALADLDISLRTAARDLRNALAAGASARQRTATARSAVLAARVALQAREAQWRAGAISQFELQDARRQLATTLDSEIAASRDDAQAWVALVRAAGPAILLEQDF